MMPIGIGPNGIEDGLVLALDAGNIKSYPRSGTTWNDLAGNNTGTLTNGPTFTTSSRESISFDGTNDYVDVTNQANFNFADTTFTVAIWLQTTGSGLMVTKGFTVGGWTVSVDTGFIGCAVRNSNGFTSFSRLSAATVNDNRWHYAVVIFTTSTTVAGNNTAQIYIDGSISQQTQTSNGHTYSVETTNLQIGRRINDLFYSGNIASVEIYNRGLTTVEIQQNFNATRSRFGV